MAEGSASETRRNGSRLGRLTGPPLIVQLIGLLVGALLAAQLVTLLLTLAIPPAPPREYALADIASALCGTSVKADRFDRVVQSGPPDLSTRGWFVSESSRVRLAGLLGRPVPQVVLGFFTQLPVGGAIDPVAAPDRLPDDAERSRTRRIGAAELPQLEAGEATMTPASLFVDGTVPRAGLIRAALLQQMPGGPPGGGFPGGGPPGGGFPGAGLPGGGFPQSLPQPQSEPQSQPPRASQPATPPQARQPQPSTQPQPQPETQVQEPSIPGGVQPGVSPSQSAPFSQGQAPQAVASSGPPPGILNPQVQGASQLRAPVLLDPTPERRTTPPAPAAQPTPRTQPAQPTGGGTSSLVPVVPVRPEAASTAAPPGEIAPAAIAPSPQAAAPAPLGAPVPIVRPRTSLFGLALAPFVEGDFVAAVQLDDGRWAVVSPRAEGFPNAWQRRVALWFLLSLLAVAPIAWLFARRIVGPLNDFAYAADVLGRDPSAAVLPLHGPAEIGRAAHAFNQMQSRLRSFVDDRTAMIGAISHDLRTPLTRLRFRIEDVPEDQQEDLRGEVAEMEEMISSVIAFMRDASIPNARERRDLAEIVDDVIEDATLLGDVEAGRVESAMVDVDPMGVRRVLNNLLTNAMKYGGGHARVVLRVENNCAVADIVDDGPGVPDGELERVFEPFYRSEAARKSEREGSGLGLAVCRSIARAHGGDVTLFRGADGFTARIVLPLAFYDDRRAA